MAQSDRLSTDSLINILMLYSVNTGLLPNVFSACVIVTVSSPNQYTVHRRTPPDLGFPQHLTMPNNLIWISIYFLLPKLELNSMLATLNARRHLRHLQETNRDVNLSIPLSQPSGSSMSNEAGSLTSSHHPGVEDQVNAIRQGGPYG
ncbi:uncharacterized protein FIBRA_06532 [Fibroporia radiculosa]|uniref:DUF6534 domain-containing protein n=1 Tax=Fibroporia radiculosa TaxID=599839 RepID=J4GSX2_9APHY|nr:uncharacterized protein FIBRA_06532 [Fibroporia radiculosa]CCM04360.1 predicted protein [Fibroporia radiculosa]